MQRLLKNTGYVLAAVLIQVILLQHLQLWGATPDLILLFLLWFAIRTNRLEAVLVAALGGFLQDFFFDTWGINMFAKTLLIFAAHNYLQQESAQRTEMMRICVLIFGAAVIHNSIVYILSSLVAVYTAPPSIWIIVLFSSLYTTIVGALITLFKK